MHLVHHLKLRCSSLHIHKILYGEQLFPSSNISLEIFLKKSNYVKGANCVSNKYFSACVYKSIFFISPSTTSLDCNFLSFSIHGHPLSFSVRLHERKKIGDERMWQAASQLLMIRLSFYISFQPVSEEIDSGPLKFIPQMPLQFISTIPP